MRIARTLIPALLCASHLCMHPPALAGEQAPSEILRPCVEGSSEFNDARQKLAAVDRQIRSLKPDSDHKAASEALIALMGHQCMALWDMAMDEAYANFDGTAPPLRAEAAPALIHFWTTSGKDWAESMLNMAKQRRLVLPTSMRKVVSRETRAEDLGLSLPCPVDDSKCGQETQGWWQRAETYLRSKSKQDPTSTGYGKLTTEAGCKELALPRPDPERYEEWFRCIRSIPKRRFVMPLGRIKAPVSGWLVVRARHGIYSFCDPVNMYSLSTGAAYISQGCPARIGLNDALPERDLILRSGSIPVDSAREAAWMLQQLGSITMDYEEPPGFFELPAGVEPVKALNSKGNRTTLVCSGGGQLITWAIVTSTGEALASSALGSGGCNSPPIDYTLELLRNAESGFVAGCARETPPRAMIPRQSKPLSKFEADLGPIRLDPAKANEVFQATRAAGLAVCPAK
jgi:hypothetical protein